MNLEKTIVPISIIIPVYNVREWIDECMESVVNQTFTDFEVILVNDGSTDGSDDKCKIWADKDCRIHYISKINEGVSVARNIGIKMAEGEYLAFVDPDDWLEQTYLEKMINKALETGADIVECDFWRYDNNTGKISYRPCYGYMGREYSLEEHVIYGTNVLWKYISKRTLWIENNIVIPDCLAAPHGVYIRLLLLSGKIVNIHEALYYYRRFRKGSIVDQSGKNTVEEGKFGLQSLDWLIINFKAHDNFDANKDILERVVKHRLSELLASQFVRRTEEEFKILAANYYIYISKKFPLASNEKYITIGGYNLNRILGYISQINNPYCRFNFTSIISIMNPVTQCMDFIHKNRYRQKMIMRDVVSSFWEIVEEIKPKYIYVDFIEERFDILQYQNGYITKSDALDEIENGLKDYNVIKRNSEKCLELWKKSCLQFINKLKNYFDEGNIILIKNYLSEEVGDFQERNLFGNIDEIREMNRLLKSYYAFFEKNCNGQVIEASRCDNYFTDKDYEYGAIPSHLNEWVNMDIANEIENNLVISNKNLC